MTHPHKHRLNELIAQAVASAAQIDNEWDHRALDWPIDQNSIVWEVGAFKGRWALQMCQRYQPRMFCFEPQPWAADVCRHVLKDYDAQVHDFALGMGNHLSYMWGWETDGCTMTGSGPLGDAVNVRGIEGVKDELINGRDIDLMMMNIEGYEHYLVPHMFTQEIFPRFLCIQMHEITEITCAQTRRLIEDNYRLMWDYGLTLSAWERVA